MFPMLGLSGSTVEVAVQIVNAVADNVAKAGMVLLIFAIAREKSEEELELGDEAFAQNGAMQSGGVAVSYD